MFEWLGKKKPEPEVSAGGSIIHRHTSLFPTRHGFSEEIKQEFAKARREVYQSHFGDATQVSHEVRPLIPHVDVMEYSRKDDDGNICVLATSGMSDLAMRVPAKTEAPRRVELIFYCTQPRQEYIDTMRWLAHFPHYQKTWIGAYHTMPNGNPPEPLWGTRNLDTILLLPSIVKRDRDLQEELILDGDGVEFLWVVPLTSAECKLKLAKGVNAIMDLFQKNRHPHVFAGDRASYF